MGIIQTKRDESIMALTDKINDQPFPTDGMVRAAQSAKHLSISISGWWLYVKQGRIERPLKLGARTSVWKAQYVRGLAENGIPEAPDKVA